MANMTEHEKALLDLAYTDGERISEGKLFDYQEKALNELRSAEFYLKKRYPKEDLEIISFQPSSKKGNVEVQFIQVGNDTEYLLKYENGQYVDNFYDVPYEKEYDAMVEAILKENGVEARVYTTFPYLISDKIESAQDLMDRRPHLGRNTEVFVPAKELPDMETANQFSEKVSAIFEENSIYTSGMVYFILNMEALNQDALSLDEYAHNRKNLRNIVSVTFKCFGVRR